MGDLFSLKNKVALVTGGTGVLGQEMVRGLAEAGAKIAILGRRFEAGDKLAKELQQKGFQCLALQADVLEENQLHKAKQKLLETFGTLDILVNAAGGNLPGAVIPPEKTFFDLNIEDFKKVVDLNLLGTVLPTQIFSDIFMQKKEGIIINISSMAAYRPITRVVGYAAAKAGVDNFTGWLSIEMAKKFGEGIRVNAIAPIASTRMTEGLLGEVLEYFRPELVSPAVAYLASEECELTSELWSVGGGSVSRIFVALADGYFKHPKDGPITVEDVVANLEEIRSEDGYIVPFSSQDEFAKLGPKLLDI